MKILLTTLWQVCACFAVAMWKTWQNCSGCALRVSRATNPKRFASLMTVHMVTFGSECAITTADTAPSMTLIPSRHSSKCAGRPFLMYSCIKGNRVFEATGGKREAKRERESVCVCACDCACVCACVGGKPVLAYSPRLNTAANTRHHTQHTFMTVMPALTDSRSTGGGPTEKVPTYCRWQLEA